MTAPVGSFSLRGQIGAPGLYEITCDRTGEVSTWREVEGAPGELVIEEVSTGVVMAVDFDHAA